MKKNHFITIATAIALTALVLTGCAPDPIPVSEIKLSENEIVLKLDEEIQLKATILPENADSGTDITWASGDASTATVSQDGTVKAVKAGNTEITATTGNGIKAICAVKVFAEAPESITMSDTEITLDKGDTKTLEAVISPENTIDKTLTWTTSNDGVATVSNGTVTAITHGEAIITATSSNGKSATCTVKVNPVKVESITLNANEASLTPGGTFEIEVTGWNPEDTTDKTFTLETENDEVATVDGHTVTAAGYGKTVVNVVTEGIKVPFTVSVADIISEAGQLKNLISDKEATSLIIGGHLNYSDYVFLCDNMPNLKTLDLYAVMDTTMPEWSLALFPALVEVTLPSGLTAIPSYCFKGTATLKSVAIPETVTKIDSLAFKDSGIETITIPGSIETFGENIFDNCTSLTTAIIEDGVKTLGKSMFYNSGLQTIELPESLEEIGPYAFSGSNLSSITLPSSLKKIDDCAFYMMKGTLDTITIPGSVTEIGPHTFRESKNVKNVIFEKGVTEIPDYAFYASGLTSVTLPDGLVSIGEWAFCETGIKKIIMPDTVTDIGILCFERCPNLEEVHLSTSLQSLPDNAFYLDTSLKTINLPDSITSIGSNVFKQTPLVFEDGVLRMPKGLKTISAYAFDLSDGTNVTKLELNDGLKTIGEEAFLWLDEITEVSIPASVDSMTDAWPVNLKKFTFERVPSEEHPIPTVIVTLDNGNTPETMRPAAPNTTMLQNAEVWVPAGTKEAYLDSQWFNVTDAYNNPVGQKWERIYYFDPLNIKEMQPENK